jgi:hypothetical protein
MANEFRTVQYRGSGAQTNAYVGVSSGQGALDSNIDYNNRQLRTATEERLQQARASIDNQRRVDAIATDNARLTASQMNASNEALLRGEQLVGEQRLANIKLREDQTQEIRKLQLLHEQKRDELSLINKQQNNESLTAFGQQMLQFSQSLWKSNVEEQKRKAEQMQAFAVLDYVLNPNIGETIRVDQAQYTRLAKQGELSQLAQKLEASGLPNDAARIRASNPFYLHTMQEMSALTATNELPDYLNKVVLQAQQQGVLVKGDPDYDLKLQAIQYDSLRNFITEKGLSGMNPVVVARYLQGPMMQALAGVSKQFNSENNRHVKEAAASQALGDAIASFDTLTDPVEVNKHISQNIAQGGVDSLERLFDGISRQASLTGNNAPLVALMEHPAMAPYLGKFASWEKNRLAEAEAALEKQNADTFKLLQAQFDMEIRRANPGDLPAIRDRFLQQASGLPYELASKLEEHIWSVRPGSVGNLDSRVRDVIELGDEKDLRRLLQNPALTNTQKEELNKAVAARQKAMSPEAKLALEQAKNLIISPEILPPQLKSATAINPFVKRQIDAVIKQREETLERRSREYWSRPNASVEGYQKWLDTQNADLIKRKISIDQFGNVPELGEQARAPKATQQIPPTATVSHNGRQVVWMLEDKTRQALLKGAYGDVNPRRTVVATPQEIMAVDNYYASTGVYPKQWLALAVRTRVKPDELLSIQAGLHGMRGSPSLPPTRSRPADAATGAGQPGTPVTRATAQQYALSAGLSPRGALWFATNMMDESTGRPTAVHDSGTGYGLFGHRLGRKEALIQYAAQRGVNPSDGQMQLQFALDEIKSRYPDVWRTVSAPNPSLNDLWRASRTWLGFSESVYNKRFNSLRTALGE